MALFCCLLLLSGILYVLGEYLDMDFAILADATDQTRFVVSTAIILLTLAAIPLALRLFKFSKVNSQLKANPARALLRWGSLRIALLGGLMFVNTVLYYVFGYQPAFGYLAVVCLLAMPFIIPTKSRCEAETC